MADAPKPQPDKIRDLARELSCDEDEQKFESAVRRIVMARVKPKAEKGRVRTSRLLAVSIAECDTPHHF